MALSIPPVSSSSDSNSNSNSLKDGRRRPLAPPVSQFDRRQVYDTMNLWNATSRLKGRNVTVGVLALSFNSRGGLADDVRLGYLPGPENPLGYTTPVYVHSDTSSNDEGRAMLQLVHMIAPAAKLCFAAGFVGVGNFASAIRALAAPPCSADILVDDVSYYGNPYQDSATAAAIDFVTTRYNVLHLSATGNRRAYIREFPVTAIPASSPSIPAVLRKFTEVQQWIVFPPMMNLYRGVSILNGLGVRMDRGDQMAFRLFVWWNQGFSQVAHNIEIYLLDPITGIRINSPGDDNIRTGIPGEIIRLAKGGVLHLCAGIISTHPTRVVPSLRMMLTAADSYYGYIWPSEPPAGGMFQVQGHTAAQRAIAVAGYRYNVFPLRSSWFSQIGPPIVFYNAGGQLISLNGTARQHPVVGAVEGTDTSWFRSGCSDYERNGLPNFCGTSAAAPNLGGVVALLREARRNLTRDQLVDIFRNTAGNNGVWDGFGGFGLVNGDAAVAFLNERTPVRPVNTSLPVTPKTTIRPTPLKTLTRRPTPSRSRPTSTRRSPTRSRARGSATRTLTRRTATRTRRL